MKKLWLLLVLILAALPVTAQKVKVTSDRNVDLTRYKTYAWADPIPPGNPMVLRTIMSAIDEELTAKGLKLDEAQPELRVSFFSSTESDLHVDYPAVRNPTAPSLSNVIPAGSLGWPITKGTLAIGLVDTATKSNVWRATASHTLENGPTGNPTRDAKTVEKPIRKAVVKMFKQFPHPK